MKVSILGSTGSIGQSTMRVIEQANAIETGQFEVEALIAGRDVESLAKQAKAVSAKIAVISDETRYDALKSALSGSGIDCGAGEAAVIEAASRPAQKTMAAISGTAGLQPTMAAIEAGNTLLLANKEAMVCAGPIVLAQARKKGVPIIPVDSEHNAVFQVWQKSDGVEIEKVTLTASGGPFLNTPLELMRKADAETALKHPNWSMGVKNSLDSATMMNKGLELIEAAYLFDLPEDQIDVLVHPQSIVHAMVAYKDGSVLAQLGVPDMQTPIAHALAWPNRVETCVERLDLTDIASLQFLAPDHARFPALNLAREAFRAGIAGTCVYNSANEYAGAAYLNKRCGFMDIPDLVRFALHKALEDGNNQMPRSIDSVSSVLHVTSLVSGWIENHLKGE